MKINGGAAFWLSRGRKVPNAHFDISPPTSAKTDSEGSRLAHDLIAFLRCDRVPKPAPLIVRMANSGVISPDSMFGADGTSCFRIVRQVGLVSGDGRRGVTPVFVCAHDLQVNIKRHPDLFYRAPGTQDANSLEV